MVEGTSSAADLPLFSRRWLEGGSKALSALAWSKRGGLIKADLPHGRSAELSKRC